MRAVQLVMFPRMFHQEKKLSNRELIVKEDALSEKKEQRQWLDDLKEKPEGVFIMMCG